MKARRRHIRLGFTDEPYPEGTHICYFYGSDEERRHVLPQYIRHGLAERESVDYVADVPARKDLPRALAKLDIPLDDSHFPGLLEALTVKQGYFPDGYFAVDSMLARLRAKYEQRKQAGYAGSRMAGEQTWALRGVPGADQVLECESRINQMLEEIPLTVMCQYDTRKFDGAMLFDVLSVHPVIIVRGHVLRNPFYVPTGQVGPAPAVNPHKHATRGPSAVVLGRMLVIQQAIDALANEECIAAFTQRALQTIPGVHQAWVHLHGHPQTTDPAVEQLLEQCDREACRAPLRNPAEASDRPRVHCFSIETPVRKFGNLVVVAADEALLRPYAPFLGNAANTISRVLEARLYESRLAKANEDLRRERDDLEIRVGERTRELAFHATHDQLTGLANRALLLDRLQLAIAAGQRLARMVAVVYLDLDSFTFVNTGLGSASGDQFLQETARRLASLVRDDDTVARIGSDEFVILLNGLENAVSSVARLNALRSVVREPVTLDGKDVVVNCSVGVCFYPPDGATPETLLRHANAAMHRAKMAGKDNIQFYAAGRDVVVTERMDLETELRQAIAADSLVLQYQPKLDLDSGKVVGAEALVRWKHPTKGMIPPSRFIPLAEESTLIVALGERVLVQACRQGRIWQDAGLAGACVSVNLAPRQFRVGDIVDTVARALQTTGLEPHRLELEITESSIMHAVEHMTTMMHQLKQLGVSISIDDFGTGHSSLSALRNFPLDKLKIDQAFVHEIETDPNAAAMARAVISIAKSLHMRVIAEGVETVGQANFLRQHHCDEIQGFLIAPPLPADQVQAMLGRPGPSGWGAPAAPATPA
jgi:diguanylate cyclase (GGDEF)-like protein